MSRWLGDFWFAYKQHPISAIMLLAALILAVAAVSAAYAIRHDRPVSVYQVARPAQGQAPVSTNPRARSLPRPNCLHGMPLGAADDDSSNSWYARHCLATPSESPTALRTTRAGLVPSPRPSRSRTASPSTLPTVSSSPASSPTTTVPATQPPTTPTAIPTPPATSPVPSDTPTGESS
jgi:hypothetical protein